jgi:FG-GAP-like repeat/Bacterial Ig domain
MHRLIAAVFTAGMALCASTARADGTLISAPNRTDMVIDTARQMIYIANGTQVLRYDLSCDCQATPLTLGGALKGMDLSPDGNTLAVADETNDGTYAWVHLVNLNTLSDNKVTVPLASLDGQIDEVGTFSVAYAYDGTLLTTSQYPGSGWVPLRKLDPATNTWTVLASVRQDTMLAPSANKEVIGFAESNISDGRWGVYHVDTGEIDRRQGYTDGTSAFNYEMSTNPDGSQFAIPTYDGTFIYNSSYQSVATLGSHAGAQPIGGTYDPVHPLLYLPWTTTSEVRIYDTTTLTQVGSYDVGDVFNAVGNTAFVQGRTKIASDGSILAVSVTGGVQYINLYAPIQANPVSATSDGGRVVIPLPASIGNGRPMAFTFPVVPAHGQVFVTNGVMTYIPDPDFTGTDAFSYAAHYGDNSASAPITIAVTASQSAYSPTVSFATLPVLSPSTPIPKSDKVPGDFNGDGASDLLWFNPQSSQVGYWTMSMSGGIPPSRTGAHTFAVTAGYYVGAMGDFNGDGYADLMFTSAARDLWLWTNNTQGGFQSQYVGTYPSAWQLIGAGDINGDGYDDLLWLDPSDCQFAYWLMKGATRIGYKVINVACGYYPVAVGYFSSSQNLSIVWTSAAGDLYIWDSTGDGFRSYNISTVFNGSGSTDRPARTAWAIGGGYAGSGIGLESYDTTTGQGYGFTLQRTFDAQNNQTSIVKTPSWSGTSPFVSPGSAGYFIFGVNTDLYVLNPQNNLIMTYGPAVGAPASASGPAPQPGGITNWTYPSGWYVVGSWANGAAPLPWR